MSKSKNLPKNAVDSGNKRKKKQDTPKEAAISAPPLKEKAVALPLNDSEKEIIDNYKNKLGSNNITAYLSDKIDDNGNITFNIDGPRGTDSEKASLFSAALCNATGASNYTFAFNIYSSCVYAVLGSIKKDKRLIDKSNEILNALNSFKPEDEFEGMLISRMIALHFQSMNFLRRAVLDDQTSEGTDLNVNRSTKLMRLYNETLETLMRYRRKGEQKVTVQHINVENGGKAIVSGQMMTGGGQQKNCEGPYGHVTSM